MTIEVYPSETKYLALSLSLSCRQNIFMPHHHHQRENPNPSPILSLKVYDLRVMNDSL